MSAEFSHWFKYLFSTYHDLGLGSVLGNGSTAMNQASYCPHGSYILLEKRENSVNAPDDILVMYYYGTNYVKFRP